MSKDPFNEDPFNEGINIIDEDQTSFKNKFSRGAFSAGNFTQFKTFNIKKISFFWPGIIFILLGFLVLLLPKILITIIAGFFFLTGLSMLLSAVKNLFIK